MLKLSELRKRTQPLKHRRIAARVTDAERALIQHAADLQGQSLTCFVLATLQREAQQVIETKNAVRICAQGSGKPAETLPQALREPAGGRLGAGTGRRKTVRPK
jgi:uncharacterized protein (DUF1778 family)